MEKIILQAVILKPDQVRLNIKKLINMGFQNGMIFLMVE